MGIRKVVVKQSAADNIASIVWYIESKGMVNTAEKFVDAVYDYFLKLADTTKSYAICKEPSRAYSVTNVFPIKRSTPLCL